MDRAFARSAYKRGLDATMLVPERYLQVENLLTVTLEAEMPRFDDSRMHRTDGDLMDFVSAHGEEVGYSRQRRLRNAVRRPIGRMEPDWLEPGMALRLNFPLFCDFALEPMRLRAFERQTRVRLVRLSADRGEAARDRIGKYAH